MSQLLKVTVRDRSGVLFAGEAKAVSSQNLNGPFDILPGHEHFISLITTKVQLTLPSSSQSFDLTSGMISVVNDEVTVLLGVVDQS